MSNAKHRNHSMLKIFSYQLCIVVISSIFGWSILTISYSIPINKIWDNVNKSITSFPDNYLKLTSSVSSSLDLYTDASYLSRAAFQGKKPLYIEALENRHFNPDTGVISDSPVEQLRIVFNSKYQKEECEKFAVSGQYSRYWHGYLVILKPLLYLMPYDSIRGLNIAIQISLLFISFMIFFKNKRYTSILILTAIWLFLNPISTLLSIQASIDTNICLFSIVLLCIFKNRIKNNIEGCSFFCIIGITTSFFDTLTSPLNTLGITLCFYIHITTNNIIEISVYKRVAALNFSWLVGYVGMWSCKWALATVVTESNIFIDAYNQILFRISDMSTGHYITYFDVLKCNISAIDRFSIVVIVVSLIYYILQYYKKLHFKIQYKTILLYCIIAISPLIWYGILQNHSHTHFWFTYRIMAISLCSFLFIVESVLNKQNYIIDETTKDVYNKI